METFDDWKLVLLTPWPRWVVAALVAAALLGVVLAALGLRKERRLPRRAVLLGLRAVAMAALLFLVLEPGVRHLQTATVKGRLAVLVDGSASMDLPMGDGKATRTAEAAEYLRAVAPALSELEKKYTLEFFRYGEKLAPVSGPEAAVEARDEATDLLGALEALPKGQGGRRLAGVLLVGDGADNAALRDGMTREARERLRALGVSVSTVSTGEGRARDLAIESLRVEDFAFVRNTVEVEVTLSAVEMGTLDVPVALRQEGEVVAQKTVSLGPKQPRQTVKLSFVPDRIGEFVFTVSVPVYEGEATSANNSETFVLKVIRDRVRTLHVVGRPSWDQRFLRTLLRNDPNVDLVSFYILRTQQDQPRASENELSLIPFPVEEIFEKQLWSFDLVVFQNFNYRPYRMDRYLPNLRKYVEEGGAFVMIGGENSFGEGGYEMSPIAGILPVEAVGAAPNESLFAPRLTESGLRHPVTQLSGGPDLTRAAWERLPQIPGINVTRARPGAQVLLEHPHVVAGGQNAPVVAVMEVGRGRTMAVTTDASWYWSMVAAQSGEGGSRHYERFWSQAIRWLVRDPDLTQVRVQAAQRSVPPGTPLAATISARRPDYAPAEGARIEVDLVDAVSSAPIARKILEAEPDGTARVEFAPPGVGAFKVIARAELGGNALGSGQDVIAVRASTLERSDTRARPELLQEIAELTGGGSISSSTRRLPEMRLLEPEVVEVGRSEDRPIWDRFWPILLLAVCLGGEWVLRRRWGYA